MCVTRKKGFEEIKTDASAGKMPALLRIDFFLWKFWEKLQECVISNAMTNEIAKIIA